MHGRKDSADASWSQCVGTGRERTNQRRGVLIQQLLGKGARTAVAVGLLWRRGRRCSAALPHCWRRQIRHEACAAGRVLRPTTPDAGAAVQRYLAGGASRAPSGTKVRKKSAVPRGMVLLGRLFS